MRLSKIIVMKYAPLIWAALVRRPAEALLTLFSITAAFALFGLMVRLDATAQHAIESLPLDRLWVTPRFQFVGARGFTIGMRAELARLEGVSGVGSLRAFGGYHVDPHNDVGVFLVDEGMRAAWSEGPLSAAQWDALAANPSGLFVSRKAAAKWHLAPGDLFSVITEPGTRADGAQSWDFKVIGIIADDAELSDRDGMMVGNYSFFDNAIPFIKRGFVDLFFVAVRDPARALAVSQQIDDRFANSGTPTDSAPKRINAQSEIERGVDMAALTWSIGISGLLMILFLTANAISRSVRERIPEFAVLETLGFRNEQLIGLVLVEVAIPCLLGAVLGTLCASLLAQQSRHFVVPAMARLIIETPSLWGHVLAVSCAFAALLATASAAVPALRLRRMSVVDALAGR